ncbi:TlpA disulfide reductase family protein [Rugamonas sp.]|uniref:TlpA family protein disulfide reductase n=1 Tax=Rugamonas sp. TaxID=1926287 RepID=UPI0025DD75AD|nr:TlpA disulfide reductase family protein [Rugamonas sp.]
MKKNNLIAIAVIALAFGAAGAWYGSHQNQKEAAALAAIAPVPAPASAAAAPGAAGATGPVDKLFQQSLPDSQGVKQALAQWKGKPMLVNFWAPWCGPCVREMPELSALATSEAGKKLQIIGIGIDSQANIAEFAGRMKISYPVYVGGMEGTDLSRDLGNTAGGLPYTVLIGADGQVKKTYLGQLKFEQLRADLATL